MAVGWLAGWLHFNQRRINASVGLGAVPKCGNLAYLEPANWLMQTNVTVIYRKF